MPTVRQPGRKRGKEGAPGRLREYLGTTIIEHRSRSGEYRASLTPRVYGQILCSPYAAALGKRMDEYEVSILLMVAKELDAPPPI